MLIVFLKAVLSVIFCSTLLLTMFLRMWLGALGRPYILTMEQFGRGEGILYLSWSNQFNKLQHILAVERWLINWGFKWSVTKSYCMFFSKMKMADKQLFCMNSLWVGFLQSNMCVYGSNIYTIYHLKKSTI